MPAREAEGRVAAQCCRGAAGSEKGEDENMKYSKYAGMSYEQASREAQLIVELLGWYKGFDRLTALKQIMDHGVQRA
jgi:hypothetical protein